MSHMKRLRRKTVGFVVRKTGAILLSLVLASPIPTCAATDKTDVAVSALQFGGSIGKLLWTSIADQATIDKTSAETYTQLALRVRQQIDNGRLSSSLISGNFDIVGTALAYSATVDPEPLSKAVAGVAAWGAKKTGDAIGDLVLQKSEEQGRAILAQGLKTSHLSATTLRNMSPEGLRDRVADMQIGGQKLRDILKDDPKSLDMLRAEAQDLAINLGVENLARSAGIGSDVTALKTQLSDTRIQIDQFQKDAQARLDAITTKVTNLENATETANQKLDAVTRDVQQNAKETQTLAQISYSGWTTSQKLQALQSDLFPDLTSDQKQHLVESLQADQARELAIANLQSTAQNFGNLASIAAHLGLGNLATGLSAAQTVASSVAKFATGDVLGALSGLTSLVGLGAPDADAMRFHALMQYLEQEFAQVNAKLDRIIELQVQTLNALSALATGLQLFQQTVYAQLDRIEDTVLRNEKLLQTVLKDQWEGCDALVSHTLNGQYTIPTREVLAGVIGDVNTPAFASSCYSKMTGFLSGRVKKAQWNGELIDASSFPTGEIIGDQALQKNWTAFEHQRDASYKAARDFVLAALADASEAPALYLARFTQPTIRASFAEQLDSALLAPAVSKSLRTFKCNDPQFAGSLSQPLADLVCYGRINTSSPLQSRWSDLLSADLIGPYVRQLLNTGVALATIVDFSSATPQGNLSFVTRADIDTFPLNGASAALTAAIKEQKGLKLLNQLRWLSEAYVLQQSIGGGEYTARLITDVLYDTNTRSLNTTPAVMNDLKRKALIAMRSNPVLARNVLLLTMRRAIAEQLGGSGAAESVRYRMTYYNVGKLVYRGAGACTGDPVVTHVLSDLLPNWKIQLVVTSDMRSKDPNLINCRLEYNPDLAADPMQPPARGEGLAVAIDDFYVLAPSPISLAEGIFEQTDELRQALMYRDRLSQAILDRQIASTIKAVVHEAGGTRTSERQTMFAVLNEGWGWTNRRKSH